jgi:hypothetical protein
MFSDRVNFDFEISLFQKNYIQTAKTRKLNEEFEFIYFFCSDKKSNLCPYKKYEPDYLAYLISLGLDLPKMDCSYPIRNWWGNDQNLELARLLNSKITSHEVGKEHGLNPEGIIVIKSFEDISRHLKKFNIKKWICRDPFGMAGSGSIVFDVAELESHEKYISKQLNDNPLILAPYFSRLMDLGFVFEDENFEVTWNLNSMGGRFKGGIVFKNIDSLKLMIKERFQMDFGEILKTEKRIVEIFKKLGNIEIIQVDSFIYSQEDSIKFYPLVEVNARKSMGYFINKLKRFLPSNGVGLFLSLNNSNLLKVQSFNDRKSALEDLLYSPSNNTGVIPLSPIGGVLSSFFISAHNLEELDSLKHSLWNKVSLPGKPLSPAFSFLPSK